MLSLEDLYTVKTRKDLLFIKKSNDFFVATWSRFPNEHELIVISVVSDGHLDPEIGLVYF